jgi:hypothetical protein
VFRFTGLAAAAAIFIFCAAGATARAQDSQPTPVPAQTPAPTLLDREYDGQTHVMFAPYIWAPTIKGNFRFEIPTLRKTTTTGSGGGGHLLAGTLEVGPSDYLPKLNTALMGAFDIRKGNIDLFADAIYLNATTNATISSTITGPLGHVHIPVTLNSSARLASGIYEVALGFTVARSHYADLSTFLGYRDFPVNLNIGWNATIGKRGLIAPSGTATTSDRTEDAVWGLKGRAFLSGKGWYIPYYGDFGGGNNNSTWEAYSGLGYAYPHGQSFILLYRQLDYYGFPEAAHTQRLDLGGPVLGYTFGI